MSKTGQSRNIISKAQCEWATSELSSSAYAPRAAPCDDRYRRALLLGLKKGCPGKAAVAGGGAPEQCFKSPQLPGVNSDSCSLSLLPSSSSSHTDTGQHCSRISPAVSFWGSNTQKKAEKPHVGRRARLPGNGGDLQESLVPGEGRKGTVYNSSWPSDSPLS